MTRTSRRLRDRAAAVAIAAALTVGGTATPTPSHAQMLVIDVIAELNTYMTYLQTLYSYTEQMNEWQENVDSLSGYVESPFEENVNGILDVVDLVDSHMGEYGGIGAYLNLFQEVPAYRLTPCFSQSARCTQARILELMRTSEIGIQGIKRANDSVFRGIEAQQRNLRQDAARLRMMQGSVTGRRLGRNAQIQAAAQLASEQANQLLQIRTLLIAQQQLQAAQAQLQQDREARGHALSEYLTSGRITDRGPRPWW